MQVIELDNFNSPELDIYARMLEVQLLTYNEPQPGVFLAESTKVIHRALTAGYEPISLLVEKELLETAEVNDVIERCAEVPIYTAEKQILQQLVGYNLIKGVLAAMRRKPLEALGEISKNARRIAVLEDVVNPTNVGAIFRSAAAMGMDAVVLTQGCSDPLYRRAIRVSMGTVFQIPWTKFPKKSEASPIEQLKTLGFKTVAMALTDDSISIDNPSLRGEEKLAIILGTEGEGLSEDTIKACDYTVKIPMAHGVDSLNVAAASAVAFWELGCRS